MVQDLGRSPAKAGSGCSAEPEPCSTVSAVPVSIPNALLALAERCEAASGPDRDLDTEILWHVDRGAFSRGYWNAASGLPRPLEEMPRPNGGLGWIGAQCSARTFTASLDAAMTLLPEGLSVALYIHPDESHCDVYRIHPSKGRLGEAEQAKSPALALCAAALKARVAQ